MRVCCFRKLICECVCVSVCLCVCVFVCLCVCVCVCVCGGKVLLAPDADVDALVASLHMRLNEIAESAADEADKQVQHPFLSCADSVGVWTYRVKLACVCVRGGLAKPCL
ncbi:MAG: hypothetical protein P4L40_01820 [Terracidiphilus sp.]|nr:hypothetical protein [Terracidiphilus sp.]